MPLDVLYVWSCDHFNQSCLTEGKVAPAEPLPREAK